MGHMKVPWYKNIETHEGPKVLRKSGTHEGPKVLKKIYMMSTWRIIEKNENNDSHVSE
jgi:hypothetical protein